MIINGKSINALVINGKQIVYFYIGDKLIWQIVNSCFSRGFWVNEQPWKNDEPWNNDL